MITGIAFYYNKMYIFVVPGNGQALLGMQDIAALKLININIDSIQAEIAEYKTNTEQEMHMVKEGCANTDADSKYQTRCQWSKWPKQ